MRRARQFAIIMFMVTCTALSARAAPADGFRVYVNDTFVTNGTKIEVLPNSIVRYKIFQFSGQAAELDLTGDGTLKHVFHGPNATFSTIYNEGSYKPQITSGSETKSFILAVSPSLDTWAAEAMKMIPQVVWPLVALFAFLVLCIWGKLHGLIRSFRLGTIEVSGIKVTSADLEISLRQEIDKTIKNLEVQFPPEMAPHYIDLSINPETGRYVHIVDFIQEIGVKIKSAKAWNAVGNYYFYQDKNKALKAYHESIALDAEDPIPHINLGMYYLLVQRDSHVARKSLETGIELAQKKGISVPWAHVGLSIVFYRIKVAQVDPDLQRKAANKEMFHNQKAKKLFGQAIEYNGADFWSYLGLGWCMAEENRFEDAIKYTSKALEIKSDFGIARYNLALFKAKTRSFAESMKDFYQLVQPLNPRLKALGIQRAPELQDLANEAEFKQFFAMLNLEYLGNRS
jgi:tetratricopeptide (TPR) repeat protein